MTGLALRRLVSQRLAGNVFSDPLAVVGWLGAVQAQDFSAALGSLAQRLPPTRDSAIEQAFAEGPFLPLSPSQEAAIAAAFRRYGDFLGLPVAGETNP